MTYQATYKILIAQTTIGGLTLPVNFALKIISISKEQTNYRLVTCTCKDVSGDTAVDNWDKVGVSNLLSYTYNPILDNAKTENAMLAATIEANLTTWVGVNWIKM